MPTVNAIAKFTGFDRASIQRRVDRFDLGADVRVKDVVMLRPLDEEHANKITLEEARTAEAKESAALKRIQREKLEGKLADIDELLPRLNGLLDGVAATIKTSPLDEARKDDVFTAIRDFLREWDASN